MKNRLEIARELLKDDGVIFIQCDDNEQAYLKVLCDEVFGRENFVNCIAIKMSTSAGLKMSHKNKRMLKIKEYILVFSKKETFSLSSIEDLYINKNYYETERSDKYIINYEDDFNDWYFCSLHEAYKKFAKNNQSKLDFVNENFFRIFNHVVNESTKKNWNNLSENEKNIYKDKVRNYNVEGSEYKYAFNDHVLIPYNPKDLEGDMWCGNYSIGGTKTEEGNIKFDNGKKREKILKRIINITTTPHDIVLDFFAGSGTTGAVAHKMNRQWIMVEQMDYIESITKERLKKVIEGEQGGISKSVNWQGGGDFVYFELKKYNQDFIDMLEKCETKDEVLNVFNEICEKGFVKYNVDIKALKEDISKGENSIFLSKTLEEMKENIYSILEKNMIYLPYSMLYDDKFECSAEEKKLSKDFYKNLLNEDGE